MSLYTHKTHLRNMIFFPHRGNPPPDQPPYVRSPGDPFTFYLPWIPCKYRTNEPTCGGCGNKDAIQGGQARCAKLNCITDRVKCHICPVEGKT